jgi:hypothetical protein
MENNHKLPTDGAWLNTASSLGFRTIGSKAARNTPIFCYNDTNSSENKPVCNGNITTVKGRVPFNTYSVLRVLILSLSKELSTARITEQEQLTL